MSDTRDRLVRSRDHLDLLLLAADDKSAPALSRELRAVMAELDALPDTGKKATVDELKDRRATRQAEAQARARSESR